MRRSILSALIAAAVFAPGGFFCALDPWTTGVLPGDVVVVSKTIDASEGAGSSEDTIFHARVPQVKMSHKKHEKEGIACVRCHHRHDNPEREKRCAACHRNNAGYETIHVLCRGCHLKAGADPRACGDCHRQSTPQGPDRGAAAPARG